MHKAARRSEINQVKSFEHRYQQTGPEDFPSQLFIRKDKAEKVTFLQDSQIDGETRPELISTTQQSEVR